jgi:hypothetical protein
MKQDSGVRRRLRVGMTALLDDPPNDFDEKSRRALLDQWWLPESHLRPRPLSDDQGDSDA